MNAFKVKKFLWVEGLTISAMARHLEPLYETATAGSLRTMLTNMLYHGDYREKLADLVEQEFGLKIDKPAPVESVAEAVKRAA